MCPNATLGAMRNEKNEKMKRMNRTISGDEDEENAPERFLGRTSPQKS